MYAYNAAVRTEAPAPDFRARGVIPLQVRQRYYGPDAFSLWRSDRIRRNLSTKLDVVLLTHPRDERDMSMLYPFSNDLSQSDIRRFAHALEPVCGEVIETPGISIGLMFMFRFADEMRSEEHTSELQSHS